MRRARYIWALLALLGLGCTTQPKHRINVKGDKLTLSNDQGVIAALDGNTVKVNRSAKDLVTVTGYQAVIEDMSVPAPRPSITDLPELPMENPDQVKIIADQVKIIRDQTKVIGDQDKTIDYQAGEIRKLIRAQQAATAGIARLEREKKAAVKDEATATADPSLKIEAVKPKADESKPAVLQQTDSIDKAATQTTTPNQEAADSGAKIKTLEAAALASQAGLTKITEEKEELVKTLGERDKKIADLETAIAATQAGLTTAQAMTNRRDTQLKELKAAKETAVKAPKQGTVDGYKSAVTTWQMIAGVLLLSFLVASVLLIRAKEETKKILAAMKNSGLKGPVSEESYIRALNDKYDQLKKSHEQLDKEHTHLKWDHTDLNKMVERVCLPFEIGEELKGKIWSVNAQPPGELILLLPRNPLDPQELFTRCGTKVRPGNMANHLGKCDACQKQIGQELGYPSRSASAGTPTVTQMRSVPVQPIKEAEGITVLQVPEQTGRVESLSSGRKTA